MLLNPAAVSWQPCTLGIFSSLPTNASTSKFLLVQLFLEMHLLVLLPFLKHDLSL